LIQAASLCDSGQQLLDPSRLVAAMTDTLKLKAWFHPSMQLPFKLDLAANPFKVDEDMVVADLMDDCEAYFQRESKKHGSPLDLQISVLWNVKDHKKALNPNEKVSQHFASGDSFGVYGDIMPVTQSEPKKEEDKLPVTILTGFLGSGKTTLLNYILQEQRDRKIAIIENEFGEISIDDELLKQRTTELAEKIIVMDNGCMCCTIRGDLVTGLQSILTDIHKGGTIDSIMIETTGMADPVPIMRTFMSSPELTAELRLDAVITMADAKHLLRRLDDDIEEGKVNESLQQISFADKIILNKLDLVTTEEAIAVKDRIREINKFAKVLPAVKGRVRTAELSNIRAHDMTNFVNEDIEMDAQVPQAELEQNTAKMDSELVGHGGFTEQEGHGDCEDDGQACDFKMAEDFGHGHGHDAHGGHEPDAHSAGGHAPGIGHVSKESLNRHDARVNSFALVKEGEILPKRLSMWMQSISKLPKERGTIFRIKAILAVKGHPYKHVFHAVMDISDEDDAGLWAEGEKRICKIVFIGKSLDEPFLRKGFEGIFAV